MPVRNWYDVTAPRDHVEPSRPLSVKLISPDTPAQNYLRSVEVQKNYSRYVLQLVLALHPILHIAGLRPCGYCLT
ncbi:hypothetical protein J1614_007885 [Plenodomus biglobosus]|nr:hypothetical protein J1614_007885 [Plenodomus biglobosus]